MRFFITSDTAVDLREVYHYLDHKIKIEEFFESRNYGHDLVGISIILMCRNPEINFKQRIRYAKDEKKLYLDLMLHLPLFFKIDQAEKNRIVLNKIIEELPPILLKYRKKIKDFDFDKFLLDFKECLGEFRPEPEEY